jgi:hypothetical protein
MAATYEPIATTTLGSDVANFTMSSIPGTYTDLRVVLSLKGSSAGDIGARFNNDSGANYSYTNLYGNGASAASARQSSTTYMYMTPNVSVSSTIPDLITMDIFSYAGSTYKSALITHSGDHNGSGGVERTVDLWRSTSAITSITFYGMGINIATGTTATLYGILKA